MKVAILAATFSKFSGIDRVAEQQAASLVRKGNEVTVFTLSSDIEPHGYKVETIGMPYSLRWQRIYRLLFFLDFKKVMDTSLQLNGFDAIYSHQYPMNIIALKAKKSFNTEYVYYNHGIAPPETFQNFFEQLYIRIFRMLTNLTIKRADRVISISKYLADVLREETGVISEVKYNTIDTVRFHPGISGERIRKNLGIGNVPLALYIGRISPHKGLHTLLHAFKRVSKAVPQAKLLIVGEPTFEAYKRQLLSLATNAVIFAGFVPDNELPEYYAASDVYVSASQWEGYNLPLAEAHACGKSAVVFNLCAHPEVSQPGDVLVEPGSINEFANALIEKLGKK
ncbi:MAG: glycosyltransferase family 4 protein [Patescibacteria group bacterium]